jgi:hypothetical protein
MKRNENIYISLEIQKDLDLKGLLLSIQFDRNAPNFHQESETISWCPTSDELDFITEAFGIIGSNKIPIPEKEEVQQETEIPSELDRSDYSHRSSEIRIAPLPNNMSIEETEESETAYSKEKELDEKVFIQADERKIDEILKRKKQMARDQDTQDTDEKAYVDKLMKQKKKR